MDAISYEYTKQRKQFGLHPNFSDSAPVSDSIEPEPTTPPVEEFDQLNSQNQFTPLSPLIDSIVPPPKSSAQWFQSITQTVELDCIPSQSIHEVNTERYVQFSKGISHIEGAWPPEIKTNEFVDKQRYVRRLINEPSYQNAVPTLTKQAEVIIAQNNTIDCYEQYFVENHSEDVAEEPIEFSVRPSHARTLCVFRDPNTTTRAATKISWHPDLASKLAVSYAITAFQAQPTDMPLHSYIWDMHAPNAPDAKLIPPASALTAIAYNPRSPDHLVGGAYNGQLCFFDLRKGSSPVESSLLERSHHDPVYDVYWIQSRTGNECCSLSTDGQLLWWDIRKLKKGYTDSMWLSTDNDSTKFGGCSMEYKSDAGATRFLVGTEQGVSILCDRKAKKDAESTKSVKAVYGSTGSTGIGAHHGPVCSIQRSPFNVKYFLTAGDWCSKVWMEDLREPIIVNRYDKSNAYVSSAQWSTTRPGVYYTAKSDGVMDAYDLYHRQDGPVYSLKVSDNALTAMKVASNGKHIAIGDASGSVTVLSVSRGLVELQKDEKASIAAMFERETKREKALEVRKAQAKRDAGRTIAAQPAQASHNLDLDTAETQEGIQHAEEDFWIAIDQKGGESEEHKESEPHASTPLEAEEKENGADGQVNDEPSQHHLNEEKTNDADAELEL